ncbi:MAG: hypothetical protein C0506_15270 [Anaerolinea sp.]|nr:hypothetical protein [Anaerolinea sp.]
MTATASSSLTADDFLLMPESEGAELVDGEIAEVPMGSISSLIAGELFGQLWTFLRQRKARLLLPQESGIAIWPGRNRVRKPDLTYVRSSRLPGGRLPEGWLTVVPDLVAEVVSPGDRVEDLEQKLAEYREAGIPLIWVIYPATRTAHVLGANRQRRELGQDGVLDGEDILPGFSIPLADIFPEPEQQA